MIIIQEWNIHGASHQLLQAIDIIIMPNKCHIHCDLA